MFDPPPPLVLPYFNPDGGFWFQSPGRWVAMLGYYGQGCVYDFCVAAVSVNYGPARRGIRLQLGDQAKDSVAIAGTRLGKVKASWLAAFPDAEFRPWPRIDGSAAVHAFAPAAKRNAVLVVRSGRLYMFSGYALGSTNGTELVRQFLSGFHFMPAACWIEPCEDDGWWSAPDLLVAFDTSKRWTREGRTWGYWPGPADRSTAGFASTACFGGVCTGYVSITIGTASTGPVVDRIASASAVSWARATGRTLAEIAASTARAIGAHKVDRITVDGVPARHLIAEGREVVILEHRGRFIVITAFNGFSQQNAKENLREFLKGFSLVA
jgi:hypothetical protein